MSGVKRDRDVESKFESDAYKWDKKAELAQKYLELSGLLRTFLKRNDSANLSNWNSSENGSG
jgi:hypothetical protein